MRGCNVEGPSSEMRKKTKHQPPFSFPPSPRDLSGILAHNQNVRGFIPLSVRTDGILDPPRGLSAAGCRGAAGIRQHNAFN